METVNGSCFIHPDGVQLVRPELSDLEILVVEDDEADGYLIERTLADHPRVGRIFRANDGVAALELIEAGLEPDLALIDLQMPRKNGFSLLIDLSCAGHLFPMVVLTSSTARSDEIRSKLRGAAQVLAKPDSAEELREMLSRTLESL